MATGIYKDKTRAFNLIDKMVMEGKPLQLIYYKVETAFGFGEKFVNKRMDRLKAIAEANKDGTDTLE